MPLCISESSASRIYVSPATGNSENEGFLESDIFISVDRVLENAKDNKVEFECEIARVMIHGILHLIGFNDKTEEEQNLMTRMENENLSLHPELNC